MNIPVFFLSFVVSIICHFYGDWRCLYIIFSRAGWYTLEQVAEDEASNAQEFPSRRVLDVMYYVLYFIFYIYFVR
jgi:hypothetical protein